MGTIQRDAHHLLHRVREVCTRPPVGVCPWKGPEILALMERADEYSPDHGAFYMTFMNGVRDLVDNAEEDRPLYAALTRPRGESHSTLEAELCLRRIVVAA